MFVLLTLKILFNELSLVPKIMILHSGLDSKFLSSDDDDNNNNNT